MERWNTGAVEYWSGGADEMTSEPTGQNIESSYTSL